MLTTKYIRDGKNQIIGTTSSTSSNGDTIVRDRNGKILGRANETFNNTRDSQCGIVSQNTADAGLLLR